MQPFEFDRYVVLRELGRGAIGVVYVAYHEGLDRKLAIKVLNKARAGRADLERRLRREARALAKLSHPNVVQVYDVGEVDGRVYVVMEFIEGETLSVWIRQRHELDEILALFAAAGRGLAAAHAAGVVHRDFKPDNVIVGVDGRPRVLDFGLARALERERDLDPHPDAPGSGHGPGSVADGRAGSGPVDLRTADLADDLAGGFTGLRASEELGTLGGGEATLEGLGDLDAEVEGALTRTGARIGTPAYMSPEQFLAKPAGEASDQFSFCVALHEAVYGCRPYTGRTQRELMFQVVGGRWIAAPPGSNVPEWLRALILRGLSPNPEDRWPSMNEVIAGLERAPEVESRRGLWFGLGLAAASVALVAAVVSTRVGHERDRCPSRDEAAATLWSPDRVDELARAFAKSGSSYADATWMTVEDRLGRWAGTWAEERVSACEAGEDSVKAATDEQDRRQSLDRRQACLVRDRRAFEALVQQFVEADEALVEGAVEAVAALPDPRRCVAARARAEGLAPPPAAVADQVEELRTRLAELDTRLAIGRWESGLPLARAAVAEAVATGYGPVIVEARLTQGRMLAQSGVPASADDAISCLQDALDDADRSRHLELVPRAATELASLSVYAKPDPIRGRMWAHRALTALDRLTLAHGSEPSSVETASREAELGLARARGIAALGSLDRLDGDNAQAEAHLREALSLLDAHAPADPERGVLLNDLGTVLAARGDVEGARAAYEQGLSETLSAYGEGHPRVGNAHYNLARLAQLNGELGEAREAADLAFVIFASARGLDHRDVAAVDLLRAAIELGEGRIDQARDRAERARVIYDRVLAADNVDRAEPHQMLGHAAFAARQLDAAATHYRAALAIKLAALPRGHIELVSTRTNLGLVHFTAAELARDAGDISLARTSWSAAIVELAQAEALLEASEGVDPRQLRDARLYLGDALMGRGDDDDARAATALYDEARAACADEPATCALLSIKAAKAWARIEEREQAKVRLADAQRWIEALDEEQAAPLRVLLDGL